MLTTEEKENFLFDQGWIYYVQTKLWRKEDSGRGLPLDQAVKREKNPQSVANVKQSDRQVPTSEKIPPDELWVKVYSQPDAKGRQTFELSWWCKSYEMNRGQVFFAVLREQLLLFSARNPRLIMIFK